MLQESRNIIVHCPVQLPNISPAWKTVICLQKGIIKVCYKSIRKEEPIFLMPYMRKNPSWVKCTLPKTIKDKLKRLPFKDTSLRGFLDD